MNTLRRTAFLAAVAGCALLAVPAAAQVESSTPPAKVGQPAQQASPGNALKFEATTKDYGIISEGETIDIAFPVTNATDRRINITRIQVSCGCTKATDNPEFIEPGQTDEIKVAYNSTGRPGRQSKTVSIFTDESEGGGLYTLTFTGEATQINYLSERNIQFGEIEFGQGATRTVDFLTFSDPPVVVNGASTSEEKVKVTLGETVDVELDGKKGKRTPIAIEIGSDYPVRPFNTVLTVDTTDPKRPRYTAPLNGTVSGQFIVAPRRLAMGRLAPGSSVTREASITTRKGGDFVISGVRTGDAAQRFTVTEKATPGANGGKTLVVSFKAPDSLGAFSSIIEVDAKMGDYSETIRLPVTVQVMTSPENAGPVAPQGASRPALPQGNADAAKRTVVPKK
ncbi:MAG: DUF1573 domain-containing protein [Candidatus Sumerlaeia bacterium]|nr:DUF1573 domain-containing protein [Candidatus Sumerlaeia bacterium]